MKKSSTKFATDKQVNGMDNLDDVLQHYGVKGMRWGVRKDNKITLKDRVDSLRRERQWKKVLGEVDNLTNDQIRTVSKRIGLENDFKRLIKKSNMASSQDKNDYIKRADLDDHALSEKVNRLQYKDTLSKKVSDATKEQREFGEKVVNVGSSLALSYVSNYGKTPSANEIFNAIVSPDKEAKGKLKKTIKDKTVQTIVDSVTKR